MRLRNPFKPLSNEEIAKKQEEKRRVEEILKTSYENAQHLLSSAYGMKYVENLETDKEALIRYCLNLPEADPIKYAFIVKAALNKLVVIYDLLGEIKNDSTRK